MNKWLGFLRTSGWVFGAAVIIYGLVRYFGSGSVPSLLISLAVVIAGPLEDILKGQIRRKTRTREEPAVELVDLATSVAFLVLLILTLRIVR